MKPRGQEPSATFDAVYATVEPLPGWLTREQARCLFDAARGVPPGGTVVEIGSHHGRSTTVLAAAVAPGVRVVAIDPFPADWRYGSTGTEQALRANLAAAGLADRVEVRVSTSRAVRGTWAGPASLVYVDGKHDALSCRDDLRWSDHVPDGGWVLVHDAFSSLGVTAALLWTLPKSRRLRYVDRVGSLARLHVGRPTIADRLRPLRELPWFLRNLVVKLLLRARLPRAAALLGHRDTADPY